MTREAFSLLTRFCVLGTCPSPLCPDRDVLLAQELFFSQNGMHWPPSAPKPACGTCAAPSSLCFPNLSHPGGAEAQLGPQGTLTGVPRPPELRVGIGMRMRMRLWCSPGSAAAPLAHSWFSPHFPWQKCGIFIRPCWVLFWVWCN